MTTKVNWSWIDHSGEPSSFGIHLPTLTNANYDDLFAAGTGRYDSLKTSIIALTKLNHVRSSASIPVDASVGSIPVDPTAQRELKIVVTYVDDVTTKKYRFEIPSPTDILIQSGTDQIDIVNNVTFAAFVTQFEAKAVSPDGNAVTVIGARLAGRNN
jgi:hypothetical protein